MNIQDIKEVLQDLPAGANIPKKYCKAVNTLIDLAQLVIDVSEVMPEKMEIKERYLEDNEYAEAYNEAIDSCTLALTKKMVGLEEVIFEHVRDMSGVCKELMYDHKSGKHGMTFKISINQKELANVIQKHMIGDE